MNYKTEDGISTCFNDEHLQKADSSIDITDDEMITSVMILFS